MFDMNITQAENDEFSRKMNSDLSRSGKIRPYNDDKYTAWLAFQAACGELLQITKDSGDTYFVRPFF